MQKTKQILILILGLFFYASSFGQTWEALMDSAIGNYGVRKYDKSIEIAKQALSVAEKQWGQDTHYAQTIAFLFSNYYDKGDYPNAIYYGRQDSALTLKLKGASHFDFAISLTIWRIPTNLWENIPKRFR